MPARMSSHFEHISSDRHEPIFLIGMGRSGTSLVFEAICFHPEVGWLSQYANLAPSRPELTTMSRLAKRYPSLRQRASRWDSNYSWLDRFRIGPSEAYKVWSRLCGPRFLHSFLLDERPDAEEAARVRDYISRATRAAHATRFAAKLTGPARIGYLSAIFPRARFVHLIRDPRAVCRSLLAVGFWRGTSRMHEPAWQGGLSEEELGRWRSHGGGPLGLAAIQWAAVIRLAREEARRDAPGNYLEIRFEDFASDPHRVSNEVLGFCSLRPLPETVSRVVRTLRDPRDGLTQHEIRLIHDLVGPTMAELGYE